MSEAHRHKPSDPELADLLHLIQTSFAYMEPRIDPPSSMYKLTLQAIADQCERGEVWSIGSPVKACVFLTHKKDCLYLGKMAVAETARGQGLARQLVMLAEKRARLHGFDCLELQSRIELVENHQTFAQLGFVKCGESAHDGYDRPTSITMRKTIGPKP